MNVQAFIFYNLVLPTKLRIKFTSALPKVGQVASLGAMTVI